MPPRNPATMYQNQAVQTAAGPQLIVMLYDRLAADIDVADGAIEARDFHLANTSILRAQQIVGVLRHSLQPDGFTGGQELLALYDFLFRTLVEANLAKDPTKIRECRTIVAPLREAWHAAVVTPDRIDGVARVG